MPERSYRIYWEDDGDNTITPDTLGRFVFDFASWTNFFHLVIGKRRVAHMTLHQKDGRSRRAKLLLEEDAAQRGHSATFETV